MAVADRLVKHPDSVVANSERREEARPDPQRVLVRLLVLVLQVAPVT